MRLHRFYTKEKIEGEEVSLTDEAVLHQMKNVFRFDVGAKVILFDGFGFDFECQIQEISKKEAVFKILEKKEAIQIDKKINLFLACIRKERFEWATEKCTELGVASITPIITERSERTHLNIERLLKIAKEASEQCGRGNIPEVCGTLYLKDLDFSKLKGESFVANFDGENISSCKQKAESYNLFIGPEGGWTDSERELFKSKGVKFISLGKTTLRAETAGVVLASMISQNS